MSAKTVFVLCTQLIYIQMSFCQFFPGLSNPHLDRLRCGSGFGSQFGFPSSPFGLGSSLSSSLPGFGFGSPLPAAPAIEATPTSGGGFTVTSASAAPPTGVQIASEVAYEGSLNVAGELPFVGTTAVEGVVPSAGSGSISHSCGTGRNGMSAVSDYSTAASVAAGPTAYGAGPAIAAASAPTFGSPAFNRLSSPAFNTPAAVVSDAFASDDFEYTPTSGGSLPVTSGSAAAPTGISVASDTAYEGALEVAGELPFVGTVGFENVLPTAGSGAVNHACGNGRNAMSSRPAGFPSNAFGFSASPFGQSVFGPRCMGGRFM